MEAINHLLRPRSYMEVIEHCLKHEYAGLRMALENMHHNLLPLLRSVIATHWYNNAYDLTYLHGKTIMWGGTYSNTSELKAAQDKVKALKLKSTTGELKEAFTDYVAAQILSTDP